MTITLQYPSCTLHFDKKSGHVTTYYPDGTHCTVWPNEQDEIHAANLHLSPQREKLLHEIVHQEIALAMGLTTCPIAYAEAHKQPMPDDAERTEQLIMAMCYFAMQTQMQHAGWWERLAMVQAYCNPYDLSSAINKRMFETEINSPAIESY